MAASQSPGHHRPAARGADARPARRASRGGGAWCGIRGTTGGSRSARTSPWKDSGSGRPLAPSTIGLIQTTVAGFYAFMADRRAEAARELAEPRWAGLTDARARWWRPGEIAGSGSYRGQAEGNYITRRPCPASPGMWRSSGCPATRPGSSR